MIKRAELLASYESGEGLAGNDLFGGEQSMRFGNFIVLHEYDSQASLIAMTHQRRIFCLS